MSLKPLTSQILILIAAACIGSELSYALTEGPERGAPRVIVIHTIGGPSCKDDKVWFGKVRGDAKHWRKFFERHPVLGIHYIVGRNGAVEASIPDTQIANHAKRFNAHSIGIELVNSGDGVEDFPAKQIDALVSLVKDLMRRHAITASAVKTHAQLDMRTFKCGRAVQKQKVDPGAAFPLDRFRKAISSGN